nr:BrnT family toxin [Aminobacter carboxidus]
MIAYDETKRLRNISKHGLDMAELDFAFFENSLVIPAKAGRSMAIGAFKGEVVIATVFKPLGSEALSVISMRLASRKERSLL